MQQIHFGMQSQAFGHSLGQSLLVHWAHGTSIWTRCCSICFLKHHLQNSKWSAIKIYFSSITFYHVIVNCPLKVSTIRVVKKISFLREVRRRRLLGAHSPFRTHFPRYSRSCSRRDARLRAFRHWMWASVPPIILVVAYIIINASRTFVGPVEQPRRVL